jgi:hypothetical protein
VRPVVWQCDACGIEVRTDDYGLPPGWVRVKAHVPREERAEAEADYCETCAKAVDTVTLASMGRPWNPVKPATKRKKKADPEPEPDEEQLSLDEEEPDGD